MLSQSVRDRAVQQVLGHTFKEMSQGCNGLGPSERKQLRMLGARREVWGAGKGSEADRSQDKERVGAVHAASVFKNRTCSS